MSVFPAASRNHVPEPWGRLMIDPDSPIIDFYPEDFKIDLNGKKFAWQVGILSNCIEINYRFYMVHLWLILFSFLTGCGTSSFC